MIKVIFLLALLKVLDVTHRPFLCAGIYAFLTFSATLLFGYPLMQSLFVAFIALVLGAIYFWLLEVYSKGFMYWLVAIGGLVIGLV